MLKESDRSDRFASHLRKLHSEAARKNPKLSGQKNLAKAITEALKGTSGKEIEQGLISQYFSGKSRPAHEVLIAFSKVVGTNPTLLLQELFFVDEFEPFIALSHYATEQAEQGAMLANAL